MIFLVQVQMLDSDKKLDPEGKPASGYVCNSYGEHSTFLCAVRLKERLDFAMRESVMENSYLNSITAHYSYWTSADCAQYVLLQLYRYRPAASNTLQ